MWLLILTDKIIPSSKWRWLEHWKKLKYYWKVHHFLRLAITMQVPLSPTLKILWMPEQVFAHRDWYELSHKSTSKGRKQENINIYSPWKATVRFLFLKKMKKCNNLMRVRANNKPQRKTIKKKEVKVLREINCESQTMKQVEHGANLVANLSEIIKESSGQMDWAIIWYIWISL